MLNSPRQRRVADFWRRCSEPGRLVAGLPEVFASPWRTEPVRVQTVNLQHVHLIATSQEAADAAVAADLLTADGWPLAFLARRTGRPCLRVTGRQVVDALLHDPAFAGVKVAVLGTRPDVAASFAALLRGNDVTLAYGQHGDARTWDLGVVADEVRERGCDVVLIALGAPKGELLGRTLRNLLPRGLIVGVGGAVEMATDDMPGAPEWVGRVGMEWAYRLAHEPRRLARRYLVESPRALLALLLLVTRT